MSGEPAVARRAEDADEAALLASLRAGDEGAFRGIVERYHPALVRLAQASVPSRAVAEEVAQDTWLAVIQGLDRFEGRSSLKTWIFRILLNQARTRGPRERRVVAMSSYVDETPDNSPAVDPDRFVPGGQRWAGHWSDPPSPWSDVPAERLLSKETVAVAADAIERLPPQQRQVITLRDVEGWSPAEVCSLLDLTEVNQRVLLHRARSRVRASLEQHIGQDA